MWRAEALLPVADLKPPAGFSILREVIQVLSPEVQLRAEKSSANLTCRPHNLEESLYMFLLRQRSVDDLVALGANRNEANT